MSIHREIAFEEEICQHLVANGWLYADGDFAKYDRPRALFPEDLIEWVKTTQPDAWKAIEKNHGSAGAAAALLQRVRESLDARGTLDVLRHGVEMLGLRNVLPLAQFKPALALNPELMKRYAANRLRVVRQVRYSPAHENSIDLVLFLNGIPVATAELKTDFTQSIEDAVDQYRYDRNPRPKGQAAEPLLTFPGGALVHFAVSNHLVEMTTKLAGEATRFLPFNRGDNGGAGNPRDVPGHPTAYLWEEIWQRDSWLEIIGRYLVAQRDDKKRIKAILFPRYHQLDATRKLLSAVAKEGPGKTYLIQHSAGSGKTNSIAWAAHLLSDLHDAQGKKVFDSVVVVSDRTVIDDQLQEAIFDFQRTAGVVATITGDAGSKTQELAAALSGDKKIVVCTLQTFPHAFAKVKELAATQGKRFVVIADEAHSSQAGQAAIKLSEVLSAEQVKRISEEGEEVSVEDVLISLMSARAADGGISYVAFTATPKSKTIELFGRVPDPSRPAGPGNLPEPFHVYSMRQAIEEGFILDVLQNYTTYNLAYKLTHNGQEYDDKQVIRSEAMKGIMGWVRLHPYNIAQKVELVVEHYREFVAPLLDGKAKAMVVLGSRKDAVRWQLAMRKYIASRNYKLQSIVAFSGEVDDPESSEDALTENGPQLNPNLRGQDIRKVFATADYQILLVANKFQTGFDQPLLCGMYVDKKLAGIQAVQTLSRLNRAYPGKDTTYVIDFVKGQAEEVLAAFKTYYTTAELANVTDPNLVFNLRAKLDATGYYDDFEVDRVVNVALKPGAKQSELVAALAPVVDRLMKQYKEAAKTVAAGATATDKEAVAKAMDKLNALQLFKGDIGAFLRLYTFLSQIFDYGNTALEKRSIFYRALLPLLEFGRQREGIDLSKVVLTHHNLKNRGRQPMNPGEGEQPKLQPMAGSGSGEVREKPRAFLREIIEKVNELFEGVTEQDKLVYVKDVIKGKLLESETLKEQAQNNSKEQFAASPDLTREILNAIIGASDAHAALSRQALGSEQTRLGLKEILLNYAGLYEELKQQTDAGEARFPE